MKTSVKQINDIHFSYSVLDVWIIEVELVCLYQFVGLLNLKIIYQKNQRVYNQWLRTYYESY